MPEDRLSIFHIKRDATKRGSSRLSVGMGHRSPEGKEKRMSSEQPASATTTEGKISDTENAKLQLEKDKLGVDHLKLELERRKAWWTAGSIVVTGFAALLTVGF